MSEFSRYVRRMSFYLFIFTYIAAGQSPVFYPFATVGLAISMVVVKTRAKIALSLLLSLIGTPSIIWIVYGVALHTTIESVTCFRKKCSRLIMAQMSGLAIILSYLVKCTMCVRIVIVIIGLVHCALFFEHPLYEENLNEREMYDRLCRIFGKDNHSDLSREYRNALIHPYRRRSRFVVPTALMANMTVSAPTIVRLSIIFLMVIPGVFRAQMFDVLLLIALSFRCWMLALTLAPFCAGYATVPPIVDILLVYTYHFTDLFHACRTCRLTSAASVSS